MAVISPEPQKDKKGIHTVKVWAALDLLIPSPIMQPDLSLTGTWETQMSSYKERHGAMQTDVHHEATKFPIWGLFPGMRNVNVLYEKGRWPN